MSGYLNVLAATGCFALATWMAGRAGRRHRLAIMQDRLNADDHDLPTVVPLGMARSPSGANLAPHTGGSGEHARRYRPGRPVVVLVAIATVVVAALTLGGFGVVVALAALAAAAVGRWAVRLGEPLRYDRAMIDAMEELSRQLRSGASIIAAMRQLAPSTAGALERELTALVEHLELGATLEEALRRWAATNRSMTVRTVCATLSLGYRSGGLRAKHVDALAESLRAVQESQQQRATQATQANASAAVMVIAPIAFAALMAAGDPAARAFLVHAPAGLACLSSGLALDLGAAAAMIKMAAR